MQISSRPLSAQRVLIPLADKVTLSALTVAIVYFGYALIKEC